MVTKQEWVKLVIELRTAMCSGTIGPAPPIHYNDPEQGRIHETQKRKVNALYAGWISAVDNCKENE